MKKRCPDSVLLGRAHINGHRLDFTIFSPDWKGGCADIVPDQKGRVWGLLYQVTARDIALLDEYEGTPSAYQRITVEIKNDHGEKIKAETYEVVTKQSFQKPSKAYLDILKKAAEKFQFPEEYKQVLDKIETVA